MVSPFTQLMQASLVDAAREHFSVLAGLRGAMIQGRCSSTIADLQVHVQHCQEQRADPLEAISACFDALPARVCAARYGKVYPPTSVIKRRAHADLLCAQEQRRHAYLDPLSNGNELQAAAQQTNYTLCLLEKNGMSRADAVRFVCVTGIAELAWVAAQELPRELVAGYDQVKLAQLRSSPQIMHSLSRWLVVL
jgi:hypothetical protein